MNRVSWPANELSFSEVAGGCPKALLKLWTMFYGLAVNFSFCSSCFLDFFKIPEVFLKSLRFHDYNFLRLSPHSLEH